MKNTTGGDVTRTSVFFTAQSGAPVKSADVAWPIVYMLRLTGTSSYVLLSH
jgi:hypothetical protein